MATSFSKTLIQIRKDQGHSSARSFYLDLQSKTKLPFNYSYYTRLETGTLLPSAKVVHKLAKVLPKDRGTLLVQSYCETLFPQWIAPKLLHPLPQESQSSQPSSQQLPIGQEELSMQQVHALTSNRICYFIFLISTLARNPIGYNQLENLFANKKETKLAVEQLIKVKLLAWENSDNLRSYAQEFRFPKGQNLEKAYSQLDAWDLEFNGVFQFNKITNKTFLRRVSGRYLGILEQLLEVIFNLTRTSDDFLPELNDDVLWLHVSASKGKLPG